MIICADYHPSTCNRKDEFECRFARNTRRYMYNTGYDNYVNVNKLYGSDVCPLTKTSKPSYVSQENVVNVNYVLKDNNPLDKLMEELKKAQDDVIAKILDACGLNVEYVKQHPEEFILQEMTVPDADSHINSITHYILSHNGKTIGEWSINTYLDVDGYSVKSIITYNTL